jgi:hypothetical protein
MERRRSHRDTHTWQAGYRYPGEGERSLPMDNRRRAVLITSLGFFVLALLVVAPLTPLGFGFGSMNAFVSIRDGQIEVANHEGTDWENVSLFLDPGLFGRGYNVPVGKVTAGGQWAFPMTAVQTPEGQSAPSHGPHLAVISGERSGSPWRHTWIGIVN